MLSTLGGASIANDAANDQQFAYDLADRLSAYSDNSSSQTYQYDANGPYRFVYDHAGHLIGEYDKNNSLRQETVWLGDTPVAVVKPAPAPQQNQVYYIQADHLNAPRVILNNANIPIWRWDHADAFGTTPPNEDPDGDGNTFEYNLRFPGQYYDQETGLHYNYFRDYDPSTGRYIQSDPIGLNGGLNTYGYVGGDPVNLIDPRGLSGESQRYYLPNSPYIPGSPANKYWAQKLTQTCENISEKFSRMFNEGSIDKNTDMSDSKTWPTPPREGPFEEGEPSRQKPKNRGECSLYDCDGGEWRPHKPDKYHPEGHWDYRSPGKSRWKNIDTNGNEID